jgi:predicted enzyme related to lactoylglutathione lyase
MGDRSGYRHGVFCFTDLQTPDPEGAKAFYTSLFGWEAEDTPANGTTYTLLRKRGGTVGALYEQQPDQREQGVPPNWLSYVSVDDVDAIAPRAVELGGTLLQEPFDVMQVGRMAVIQDPQGAFFAVWQAGQSFGAEVVNEPGAVTLNQLTTSDVEGGSKYYSDLFGWTIEKQTGEGEGPDYWGIFADGNLNGGLMALPPGDGIPPHWLVYFGTEDVDATTRQAEELGGGTIFPPTDIPGGRFSVLRDPQGGMFAVFAGRFDP